MCGSPGKSTLSLVSFAKYEWFEEWVDDKVTNRGPDYKDLKQTFIDTALDVVMDVMPKITRDKVSSLRQCHVMYYHLGQGEQCYVIITRDKVSSVMLLPPGTR